MAKQKGTELIFNLDSSIVSYAKSFDYTITGNLVETTNLSDGEYLSFMPIGGKNINGSVEVFVVPTADASRNIRYMLNAFSTNASLGFSFTNGAMQTISGACYINDIKVGNPGAKDLISGSCTFQSTGPFTIA